MTTRSRPRTVCMYGGASNAGPASYYALAAAFGAACAARGYRLVNGGGKVGLMGAAARACRDAGGTTLGVIPHVLVSVERVDRDGAIIEVASMHERKQRMFDESDGFVVLPGGIGTLDEAIETMSWHRLGLHDKLIVFLDEDGYWAPLHALLQRTVDAGLTAAEIAAAYTYVHNIEDCFGILDAATGHGSRA